MNTKRCSLLLAISAVITVGTHAQAAGEVVPVFYCATPASGAVGVNFSYEAEALFYGPTTNRVDWTTAEGIAVALGGHLVTINSDREQDALERIFIDFGVIHRLWGQFWVSS